jgi:hypothetical protein
MLRLSLQKAQHEVQHSLLHILLLLLLRIRTASILPFKSLPLGKVRPVMVKEDTCMPLPQEVSIDQRTMVALGMVYDL